MQFDKTKKFQKGLYSENLVKGILHNHGYIVYEPYQETDNSKWELFDIMALKRNIKTSSHNIFIGDIKSKARMHYYNAIGIDLRHFHKYCKMSTEMNVPFKLFVIDEFMRKIYGINITPTMVNDDKLQVDSKDGNTYPMIKDFRTKYGYDKMILFSLEHATIISNLSDEDTKTLRDLNDRPRYKHIDFDNSFTEEQKKLIT
jgi:hypothetical protein